ncbi:diguanylate cyclase [Alishewanella sp. d11]|uniref:diguanylate cyclase n=1 Tax=Alishewanella sp. d11 TaxID=3414030 RepID=UPI003BF79013
MKTVFIILLLLAVFTSSAAETEATPEWLVQVAAKKHQAPEQMLSILEANQAEFANLTAEQQAFWLNQQAAVLSYLGRYQEQQNAALQGLNLLGDSSVSLKAELMFELGYAREMQLALSEALSWYQQGLALAKDLAEEKLQVRGMINIAAIDSMQDRDQQALQTLKQAYSKAKVLNDKEVLAEVNAQLGLMYSALSFEQEAQEFLEQALALYAELGWQKNHVTVLYNLARNYSYLENFERALQSYESMLQSALKEQDVLNLYYAYSGLAITSNEMGRPQVALNYMQKAEEYLDVIQSDYYLAGHHYEKALIYQALQQNTQAMQQLLLAEEHYEKLEDKESGNMLLALHLLKAELLAEQGQYERAYQQLFQFVYGFQQFRDKENELALAKTRMAFEAERDVARQSLLEQEYQLKALQLAEIAHQKQIQWMWMAMLVVLGVILIATLLLLRSSKRNQARSSTTL